MIPDICNSVTDHTTTFRAKERPVRPMAFLDLEATGLDVANDRIIQVGILKVAPDGAPMGAQTYQRLVNPGRPIPEEVVKLTGITDDMVRGAPEFLAIAPDVVAFLDGCDLLGFNINGFDLPLLAEEVLRAGLDFEPAGVVIDCGTLFKLKEPRTLAAAFQFYLGRVMEGNHDALADARAVYSVFLGQMNLYPDLAALSREDLAKFTAYDRERVDFAGKLLRDKDGDVVYNVGQKTKGVKIRDDPGMAHWMLDRDFPLDTKRKLRRELERLEAAVARPLYDNDQPF